MACLCGMVHFQKKFTSLPIPDCDLVAAEVRRIANDHVEASPIRGEYLGPRRPPGGRTDDCGQGVDRRDHVRRRAWGLVLRVANHACVGAGAPPERAARRMRPSKCQPGRPGCRYSSRRCTPSNSDARIVTSATESSAPAPMRRKISTRSAGRSTRIGAISNWPDRRPLRFSAVAFLGHLPVVAGTGPERCIRDGIGPRVVLAVTKLPA